MPRTRYLIGWAVYLTRLMLWAVYGLLAFFSKPGTRRLMPFALFALCVLGFDKVAAFVVGFSATWDDSTFLSGSVLAIFAFGVACWLYLLASRFLSMLLSVFPPIRRPLPPIAPLATPKRLDQPVPARIAVPPFI